MDHVRTRVVEAGRIRCHIYEIVPGVPGTSLELEGALLRLDPGVVAADVDLLDVMAYRRSAGRRHAALPFPSELVRREMDRRDLEIEVQNPYQAAAEHAQRKSVPFVPLAPEASRPGFFLRRRLARAYEAVARAQPQADPRALCEAWIAVARREPDARPLLEKENAEVARRFRDLVVREQAVRVVAVVRPPRAEALARQLEQELLPVEVRAAVESEVAQLEPSEVGRGLR